ncbi:Pleckstrin y domain-containing A member 8 [Ascosphaera acerosa]|nr:Pleckstrin y domain-containing A member 8 [Ascosphaera acerosa]
MSAPSWFDSLRRSFADVSIDENDGINTTEFLEAAEALTTLFDLLGSVAFTPVKNDLLGNVKKIREYQLSHVAQSDTLQSLASDERAQKKTATEGLLWLVRGLDFTAQSLRHNLNNPTTELADSFRTAYTTTLKPYHSFIVKPIFSAAMSATPYRKDFYAKLGPDLQDCTAKLSKDVAALEKQVAILKAFLAQPNIKF